MESSQDLPNSKSQIPPSITGFTSVPVLPTLSEIFERILLQQTSK